MRDLDEIECFVEFYGAKNESFLLARSLCESRICSVFALARLLLIRSATDFAEAAIKGGFGEKVWS